MANPQVTLPDVQWNCKVEKFGSDGTPAGELAAKITVGEKFFLSCDGPTAHLEKNSLSLEVPKEMQYMLRLLDARSVGETSAQFVATTYMVGDFDFKNPILTDGKTRVGLGQFSLHSVTVITKEKNPENKPYGPWSAQAVTWPAAIWLILAALCAVIVLMISLALRRSARLKKLRVWLGLNQSALTPYNQLNRDLRMLSRKIPAGREFRASESEEYFAELERSFRFYLTRELDIYAVDAKSSVLLRDLKRVHPQLFKEHHRRIGFIFKEIAALQKMAGRENTKLNKSTEASLVMSTGAASSRADAKVKTGSIADAQQLTETCRKLADLIDRREKDKSGGR